MTATSNAFKSLRPYLVVCCIILLATVSLSDGAAYLRLVHDISNFSNDSTIDIYVYNGDIPYIEDFSYMTVTPYNNFPAGTYTFQVYFAGTNISAMSDTIVPLEEGKYYTGVAHGSLFNSILYPLGFAFFLDDLTVTDDSESRVSFFHGGPGAPDVDVRIGSTTAFSNIAYSSDQPSVIFSSPALPVFFATTN